MTIKQRGVTRIGNLAPSYDEMSEHFRQKVIKVAPVTFKLIFMVGTPHALDIIRKPLRQKIIWGDP